MLHLNSGLSINEVIQRVIEGIKMVEVIYDIKGNFILSCIKNMSEEDAILVIEEGKEFLNKGVVAIYLKHTE